MAVHRAKMETVKRLQRTHRGAGTVAAAQRAASAASCCSGSAESSGSRLMQWNFLVAYLRATACHRRPVRAYTAHAVIPCLRTALVVKHH